MLKGRLGLEGARIPHSNRTGLLFLSYGALTVRDGTLMFLRKRDARDDVFDPGNYSIPYQNVSSVMIGPGTTVSHDALRLLARHGTALIAVGEDGVRMYTAPPMMTDRSILARRQAMAWSRKKERITIARRMYAWRLGEIVPHRDITVLRGIEGARMRETYKNIAQRIGIDWKGRRYDRNKPESADIPNQAINHASSATEGAAAIAVNATATIPQLGFIHEDPGQSFVLDISDLFRDQVIIPAAFRAARKHLESGQGIERLARKEVGYALMKEKVIHNMIERIKDLFPAEENPSHK